MQSDDAAARLMLERWIRALNGAAEAEDPTGVSRGSPRAEALNNMVGMSVTHSAPRHLLEMTIPPLIHHVRAYISSGGSAGGHGGISEHDAATILGILVNYASPCLRGDHLARDLSNRMAEKGIVEATLYGILDSPAFPKLTKDAAFLIRNMTQMIPVEPVWIPPLIRQLERTEEGDLTIVAFLLNALLNSVESHQPPESAEANRNTICGIILCFQCGKQQPTLSKCSRCKVAQYCSKHCQKLHWKQCGHKSRCMAPTASAAAAMAKPRPSNGLALLVGIMRRHVDNSDIQFLFFITCSSAMVALVVHPQRSFPWLPRPTPCANLPLSTREECK
ncbi:MYND finger [Seminavis robusta]|uniref:MYND finger n=1 Tax=Seminavis robusta TaxID=568900 RepID=A0A9N8EFS5_9STRA|nr:MYND finger [Seminavis robusta]|eukprot:Sro880_g214980.1 MYND finger (334) ;mRNA; r:10975-11976